MKIVGIDPGYDRLGIAVIEKKEKGKEELLYSECFQTSSKDTIYTRLNQIGKEVCRIMDEFKPEFIAIETLFITRNQKTAMRVAEVRGIIIYESGKRSIDVYEFSPMEIKMAITGDGTSDKFRMTKMVRLLLNLPEIKTEDDEYDAIAVALTGSARYPQNLFVAKNNKSATNYSNNYKRK